MKIQKIIEIQIIFLIDIFNFVPDFSSFQGIYPILENTFISPKTIIIGLSCLGICHFMLKISELKISFIFFKFRIFLKKKIIN